MPEFRHYKVSIEQEINVTAISIEEAVSLANRALVSTSLPAEVSTPNARANTAGKITNVNLREDY